MGDIAINTPTVQDESLQALNARVRALGDQTLGFGVFEGTEKQQLRELAAPAPFCSHQSTTTDFKSTINTATHKGATDWEIITNTVPAAVDVGVQGRASTEWRAVHEESVVVYQFKRMIAKRSMPTPAFSDLLPVKKGLHLDGDRWLVELYGNEICTTEYYGGEASIAFRWNHDAKVSTTRIMAAIQSVVADTRGNHELTKSPQMSGLSCHTDIKGFKVPDRIQQKLTTVLGVMELVSELSHLPIECAVLVKQDSIPIQAVTGFPLWIQVETHIRENEILEKLTQVELQIGKTDPLNRRAFNLVRFLKHTVEDASRSNRPLLPHLSDLANTVAETLAQHGRRVAVYSRNGEMRLCSDNKFLEEVAGVCIQASPFLWPLIWPARRHFQATQFRAAPVWTVPAHYELHTPRENPQMQRGLDYYTSAKLRLYFNDNEVLDAWRRQIDQLLSRRFVADPHVKKTWFTIPTSAIFIVIVFVVVFGWREAS